MNIPSLRKQGFKVNELGQQGHLKIDITFDSEDAIEDTLQNDWNANARSTVHLGIQCCELIKGLIKLHPQKVFQDLILVLKKFLALRDLNSPYHGKSLPNVKDT